MNDILRFFDKLEDDIRAVLSRHSFFYSFIGGVAIVLFWRGVWITADAIPFLTGPVSIIISTIILLSTGLFVSFFIGDEIIISGVKKEKRLDERVAFEIKTELEVLDDIQANIDSLREDLKTIKEEMRKTNHVTKQ